MQGTLIGCQVQSWGRPAWGLLHHAGERGHLSKGHVWNAFYLQHVTLLETSCSLQRFSSCPETYSPWNRMCPKNLPHVTVTQHAWEKEGSYQNSRYCTCVYRLQRERERERWEEHPRCAGSRDNRQAPCPGQSSCRQDLHQGTKQRLMVLAQPKN